MRNLQKRIAFYFCTSKFNENIHDTEKNCKKNDIFYKRKRRNVQTEHKMMMTHIHTHLTRKYTYTQSNEHGETEAET